MTPGLAVVTGGTGFVGSYIARALAGAGWRVRLLTRRAPLHPLLAGVKLELVLGGLEDAAALSRLVEGAELVVHAAGLVQAGTRRDFFAVNEAGTRRLAEAVAQGAAGARFILISSQAARQPALSAYAASKRAGEAALAGALPGNWVVLRPGVVYGPWDYQGIALRRLASLPIAPMVRPEPRLAMIHADDVAAAVVALGAAGPGGVTHEVSDQRQDGYLLGEILCEVAARLGVTQRLLPVPDTLLRAAGGLADAAAGLRRKPTIFGRGKVRELLHGDWRPDITLRPAADIWTPRVTLADGLDQTVAWWRSLKDS